ncbi:hypothetical protein DAEQUDRAFT_763616 [Daedalea quercina L-15889]|uniref:Arrestin C-terminal-like domain-containing protein n=1 Tax=Daedalea quercina L-15889 TaxID=1314783 RepID=A0A165SBV6_9APHY|nr:hypothetical protein DAEQUDRAFT_763616 [Daedalea quercina L-15889]
MSFVLTRPPSPRPDMHPHPEEDSLITALNSAFQSLATPAHDHDMHRTDKKDRDAPCLDILVASDTLVLRGTGVDVDPALLSGNVVLHLTEPTSIKEITLQFRGKARLPVSSAEPLSLSSSSLTYLVCNHEWSFLEGNRSHAHTLKAGRHLFPFQLQIGGSLPSSVLTSALGGASVHYKLRATAVRPGFAITHRDLTALCPITILRGFGSEALEYQQTLEIENTWPEKLMYSIMIPHKAWAAGEKVTAVVKFSPLVKGARVLNVTTTINETIKLYTRGGMQESTRVISSTRHDIVEGKAVCVDEQHHRYRIPLLHSNHNHHATHRHTASMPATPANGLAHHHDAPNGAGNGYFPPAPPSHPSSPQRHMTELAPLTTTTTNSSQSSGHGAALHRTTSIPTQESSSSSSSENLPQTPPQPPLSALVDPQDAAFMEPSVDVVTTLHITVPMHATPSHSLEPIQVSHRIRWSILIGNLDGHTSELRCSLPLHVLDNRLYDEARAATLHTRRILLGPQDVDGGTAVGTHGEDTVEEDTDLPSYSSHVRDRVANAYLPDTAAMRVMNPWVMQGVSPTIGPPRSEGSSGVQSPAAYETWQVAHSAPGANGHAARRHLPQEPPPGAAPLEWVNTELLLSLSREAPEMPVHIPPPPANAAASAANPSPPARTPPESSSSHSPAGSGAHSRFPSRRPSRASSPERGAASASASATPGGSVHAGETFVHSGSHASRNMHSLFNIAMKPFTSLSSTFSLSSRSPSHTSLLAHAHAHGHAHGHGHHAASTPQTPGGGAAGSGALSASASSVNLASLAHHPQTPQPMTTPEQLHYAFTEVPDYDMASRGFLGGGITPLTSLQGLPSYDDAARERNLSQAERSFSDTDLAGMFGAAQRQARTVVPRPMPRTTASTPPPPPP